MIRLNLGCGQNKQAGYINIDKFAACDPDLVWDLDLCPWPFETSSVTEIMMTHVLEHLGPTTESFLAIIKELYRVCAPGGTIHITVPHPRSDSFISDPTHVRPILPSMMTLFSKDMVREWAELNIANTPLATYIDVDFAFGDMKMTLMPHWSEQMESGKLNRAGINHAIQSYNNVVSEMSFTLTAIKQ
jgi:SAM-dependent methyltransferase